MERSETFAEQNQELRFGALGDLISAQDRGFANGPSSVMAIPESLTKDTTSGQVSVSFPLYGWLLFLGDLMLITIANSLSVWIRFGKPLDTVAIYTIASAITLSIYPMSLFIFDLYNVKRSFRSRETAYRSALAIALGGFAAMIAFYLLPYEPYGRGIMAIELIFVWIFLNGWRRLFGFLFQAAIPRIPALILGAGHCGRRISDLLKSPLSPYEIKGFLDDNPATADKTFSPSILGTCEELTEVAARTGANTAILAIPRNRSAGLIQNVLSARLNGIHIRDMADVYEELTGRIPVHNIGDQWLLFTEGFYLLRKEYVQKLKRLLDFVVSGFIILLISPIVGLAALAIRIESPGPVFYNQKRVGKGEKVFTIYKLRSMRHDAETGSPRWAAKHDPRVTNVGRILRLTHLDEVPQIWNILKGDMSLVGPRPERPEFVQLLEKQVPYYSVRHTVKPGMTGWAQINYEYGASTEDAINKLEYDLYYVKNMSLFLDFKIFLRTIGVVLLSDGAR